MDQAIAVMNSQKLLGSWIPLSIKQTQPEHQLLAEASSSQTPRRSLESLQDKHGRLQQSAQRKVRALSPWNVFQKEKMEGLQLQPSEYKDHVRKLGTEWKAMSDEEKYVFKVKTQHEQNCRDELASIPLAVRNEDKNRLEIEVGKKGCSKLSAKRLHVNTDHYQDHFLWKGPTQMGDGHLIKSGHRSAST